MSTSTSLPQQPGRYARAKMLGKLGYTLSENAYCRGLFEVRKPNGTVYQVDPVEQECSCPATVRDCAHVLFVRRCVEFVAAMERRRVMVAERKGRGRGARRAAALRKLADRGPVQPAPSTLPPGLVCAVCGIASLRTPSCLDERCPNPMKLSRDQEIAASLYEPSRLEKERPAAPYRPSPDERQKLRDLAVAGMDINRDF